MRIEHETTVDGRRIEVLVPETADDLAELQRLERSGGVDDRLSFGDEPPRRKRRRQRTRR